MSETSNPKSTRSPKLFRQGDVLLECIAEFPPMAKLQPAGDHVVLATGEATGHAHVVRGGNCRVVRWSDGTFLELTEPGELCHEEHSTISLAPGKYRVVRQREYQPGVAGFANAHPVND